MEKNSERKRLWDIYKGSAKERKKNREMTQLNWVLESLCVLFQWARENWLKRSFNFANLFVCRKPCVLIYSKFLISDQTVWTEHTRSPTHRTYTRKLLKYSIFFLSTIVWIFIVNPVPHGLSSVCVYVYKIENKNSFSRSQTQKYVFGAMNSYGDFIQ